MTLALAALFYWGLLRFPALVLGVLCVLLVVAPVAYLVTSALSSPRPDRTCPECGEERLVPLSPGAQTGVRCEQCGHVDEAASTALLDDPGPA